MSIPQLDPIQPNFTKVIVGSVTVWFSYKSPIAFYTKETGRVLSENCWSTTTGKHLNQLGDKSERIPREAFMQKLGEVCNKEL